MRLVYVLGHYISSQMYVTIKCKISLYTYLLRIKLCFIYNSCNCFLVALCVQVNLSLVVWHTFWMCPIIVTSTNMQNNSLYMFRFTNFPVLLSQLSPLPMHVYVACNSNKCRLSIITGIIYNWSVLGIIAHKAMINQNLDLTQNFAVTNV